MGRNKNKYVKDKNNQPGFCYTKQSNANVKNSLDNFMEEFGFEENVVYSENKDKRWDLKEELAKKVANTITGDESKAALYEIDSFKPKEGKCIAISGGGTKKSKTPAPVSLRRGKEAGSCQKCQIVKPDSKKENEKSSSAIVFCKDIYQKRGLVCTCCHQQTVHQKNKFKNEKIRAFSECAYDPYMDETEDDLQFDSCTNENVLYEPEEKLRPMSIDIESILNMSNDNLRFKPRDPDNGFELINPKFVDDNASSSDFEYIGDDEMKLE